MGQRKGERIHINIWREAQEAMLRLGKRIEFDGGSVIIEGERLEGTWKETWGKVKKIIKKETKSNRKDSYWKKELQRNLYRKQHDECNVVEAEARAYENRRDYESARENGRDKSFESLYLTNMCRRQM